MVLDLEGNTMLKANKVNSLYVVKEHIRQAGRITEERNQSELWHNRFGHVNIKDLKDMASKKRAFGIHIGRGDLSPI